MLLAVVTNWPDAAVSLGFMATAAAIAWAIAWALVKGRYEFEWQVGPWRREVKR